MSYPIHEGHSHAHGQDCGHTAIRHNGHTDYLHDGCLHHPEVQRVEEHHLDVNDRNPNACTPDHRCADHEQGHRHGPGCGHPSVPHGDHTDYLVGDHLHHPHGEHCDDHGLIERV